MSLETKQPEPGDDRIPDVEVARLQEMYDRPAYDRAAAYESDIKEVPEAGIGDYVMESARYPSHLGRLTLARVHITHARAPKAPPAIYLG